MPLASIAGAMHYPSMTNAKTAAKTISPRKAKKECDRIRAGINAILFDERGMPKSVSSSESEVLTYLRRDLCRMLPFCQERGPVIDTLWD